MVQKKKNHPGKPECQLYAEELARLSAEAVQEQARLAAAAVKAEEKFQEASQRLREQKPSPSVKCWQAGTWNPKQVTVDTEQEWLASQRRGLPIREKRHFQTIRMTYLWGGRGEVKEDKNVVGYVSDAFLKCPSFKDGFSRYGDSFVLTTGDQKEVVAICLFYHFEDMAPETFVAFNKVTTTLRFMEQVRAPVTTDGAKMSGKMYAHGFRTYNGVSGPYANPNKTPEGQLLEAEGIERMREVDRFLQTNAYTFAHGCMGANNRHAEGKSLPGFSWETLEDPGDEDLETVLGSNVTWPHSGFSNKSHLDNDDSPFAYFLSAPTFSETGALARKQDGYDVAGGEFLFPSLR